MYANKKILINEASSGLGKAIAMLQPPRDEGLLATKVENLQDAFEFGDDGF